MVLTSSRLVVIGTVLFICCTCLVHGFSLYHPGVHRSSNTGGKNSSGAPVSTERRMRDLSLRNLKLLLQYQSAPGPFGVWGRTADVPEAYGGSRWRSMRKQSYKRTSEESFPLK